MDMEAAEEFVGSSNNDPTLIVKGKRTKRHRPLSPAAVGAIVMNSTSSSDSGDGGAAGGGGGGGDYGSFSSMTTTYESTEDEEDMANCLILLAQGGDAHSKDEEHHHHQGGKTERGSSRKLAEMAAASATKIGFYIYECKTCNRTFPSFQALGGHRASHKKPKVAIEEKKLSPPPQLPPSPPQVTSYHELEEAGQLAHNIKNSPQISLQFGSNRGLHINNKAKIHECSICGSEFTSGQALGGHMRRHRASTSTSTQAVGMNSIDPSCNTTTTTTTAVVEVKSRSILQLDLNLPAPEDDLRDTKFQFAPTQKSLVLSAPALVGCHY